MKPALLLAVALTCAFSLAPSASTLAVDAHERTAQLRAEGPEALERLLAEYDAMRPGVARDELELRIDAVAGQKYATTSRLYWHTDLAAAQQAARASGRPILSLRMLGRLDEDLSCANSRLFRVVLYANTALSRFLRETFVLHWSTARPVPKVTIDFGDGRELRTTLTGNSAHYVLDADGRPLDVLPGLYDPVAFRRELEALLPLARESNGLAGERFVRRLDAHHRARALASEVEWLDVSDLVEVSLPRTTQVVLAQQIANPKSRVEMPLLRAVGRTRGASNAPLVWHGRAYSTAPSLDPRATTSTTWIPAARLDDARPDAASRALLERLRPTDWGAMPAPLAGEALEALVTSLAASVALDTHSNERELHARIHTWFTEGRELDFASLDERLYSTLFETPASDPWLGLGVPGTFTALPSDGLGRDDD